MSLTSVPWTGSSRGISVVTGLQTQSRGTEYQGGDRRTASSSIDADSGACFSVTSSRVACSIDSDLAPTISSTISSNSTVATEGCTLLARHCTSVRIRARRSRTAERGRSVLAIGTFGDAASTIRTVRAEVEGAVAVALLAADSTVVIVRLRIGTEAVAENAPFDTSVRRTSGRARQAHTTCGDVWSGAVRARFVGLCAHGSVEPATLEGALLHRKEEESCDDDQENGEQDNANRSQCFH